ncbi:hypothetical protein LJC63_05580 [Ruminococcaceae bacterium OttesenSCG-928-L11]|nr:hypothetical protein [Ruminococcaceae bacterium OttesenSCG-928-L11]
MNILAVDEDWWDRKRLKHLLAKALPEANICVFDNTSGTLMFAENTPLGAPFIDLGKSIHTPGYFLAKNILVRQKTNIIFTNYEWEHMLEAFELRVRACVWR